MAFSWRRMKRNFVSNLARVHNVDQSVLDRTLTEQNEREENKNKPIFTLRRLLLAPLWTCVIAAGITLTVTMSLPLVQQWLAIVEGEPTSLKNMGKVVVNEYHSGFWPAPFPPILCISLPQLSAAELWYMQLYDAEIPWRNGTPEYYCSPPGSCDNGSEYQYDIFPHLNYSDFVHGNDGEWPNFVTKAVDIYFTYDDYRLKYGVLKIPQDTFAVANWARRLYNISDDNELYQRLTVELRRLKNQSSTTAYQDAVSRFFSEQKTNTKAAIFSSRWKPSWLFIVFSCLNIATKCELADEFCDSEDFPWWTESLRSDRRMGCILLEKSLRNVRSMKWYENDTSTYVVSLPMSTNDLRHEFGRQILILYDGPSPSWEYWDWFSLSFERVTVVNSAGICYEISATSMSLMKVVLTDYLPHKMPFRLSVGSVPKVTLMLVVNGFERDQIDYRYLQSGRRSELANILNHVMHAYTAEAFSDMPLYVTEMSHSTSGVIKLAAVYRYLNVDALGLPRCSDIPSYYSCYSGCVVAAIQQSLNCTTTSLNSSLLDESSGFFGGFPECTIEALTNSTRPGSNSSYDEEDIDIWFCYNSCLRPCEDWRVSVQLIADTTEEDYFSAAISYGLATESYTVYQEAYSVSRSEFVADLGGIVGLWLGIDLILITEVVVLIVQFVISFLMQKLLPSFQRRSGKRSNAEKKCGTVVCISDHELEKKPFDPYDLFQELRNLQENMNQLSERIDKLEKSG